MTSVAFGTTADGRLLLASASDDTTLRLWDPATGAPAGEPLTGHTCEVRSVAFGAAANGRLPLTSASVDRTITAVGRGQQRVYRDVPPQVQSQVSRNHRAAAGYCRR